MKRQNEQRIIYWGVRFTDARYDYVSEFTAPGPWSIEHAVEHLAARAISETHDRRDEIDYAHVTEVWAAYEHDRREARYDVLLPGCVNAFERVDAAQLCEDREAWEETPPLISLGEHAREVEIRAIDAAIEAIARGGRAYRAEDEDGCYYAVLETGWYRPRHEGDRLVHEWVLGEPEVMTANVGGEDIEVFAGNLNVASFPGAGLEGYAGAAGVSSWLSIQGFDVSAEEIYFRNDT